MDNLTHSLTGVLAGRLVRDDGDARRTMFWTSLMAVNVPDADVLANLFVDPLTSLHVHRGITHSLLAAPVLALIPAIVAAFFARGMPFRLLWGVSLLGIVVHIYFDLITAYGTQILYPLSTERFALDWLFIVDPWFTLTLLVLVVLARWIGRWRRALQTIAMIFVPVYLTAAVCLRTLALEKFNRLLETGGEVSYSRRTVLPQPLAMTRWVGLARTDSGLVRAFITNGGDATGGGLRLEVFTNARDRFVDSSAATSHVADYLRFARFPFIVSQPEGEVRVVEYRDYQFSVDPWIIEAFGAGERDVPFVLKMFYDSSATLTSVTFNDKTVPLRR